MRVYKFISRSVQLHISIKIAFIDKTSVEETKLLGQLKKQSYLGRYKNLKKEELEYLQ